MASTVFLLTLLVVLLFYVIIILFKRNKYLRGKVLQLKSDHKSLHIKHGKHFEHFVPFMDEYPGDKENSVFLGNPIDFISFDDESIKFIEVKTGKSSLSEKQKNVKNLVQDKKIEWYELRFEK